MPPCPNCPKSKPPVAAWRRTWRAASSPAWCCAAPTCAGRSRARWRRCCPGQRMLSRAPPRQVPAARHRAGSALLHLGMSGMLRVLPAATPVRHPRPRRHRAGFGPRAALHRPAPLRLPAVAAGRRDPRPAAGPGPGAAVGRLRRRLPVPAQPRPQGAGQDLPDGPGGGGRAWATSTRPKACSAPASPRRAPPARSRRERYGAAGRGREGRSWPTPSPAAAPPCATSSARTARPAISSRSCSSTAAKASPARPAAARSATAAWATGPPSGAAGCQR